MMNGVQCSFEKIFFKNGANTTLRTLACLSITSSVSRTFCLCKYLENGFLVSKETVVLRRWEGEQKFDFIKRVDKG